jgi:hypothetical protein
MSVSRFSTSSIQSGFEKFNSIWDGFSAVGAMEPISAITLTGAQSSISFNNIPGTYMHLQIRGIARGTNGSTGADSGLITFNNDLAANYAIHRIWGNGSSASSDGFANINDVSFASLLRSGNTANCFGTFVIDVLDYCNTNKFKTMRALNGWDANGSGEIWFQSGHWRNTNAISTLRIAAGGSGNNFAANSMFALYGVR